MSALEREWRRALTYAELWAQFRSEGLLEQLRATMVRVNALESRASALTVRPAGLARAA